MTKSENFPVHWQEHDRFYELVQVCHHTFEISVMISDVLFDAINDLNYYLNEPAFADTYTPETRAKVQKLIEEMQPILAELDAIPTRQ